LKTTFWRFHLVPKGFLTSNEFGKCALFPKENDNDYFLVNGAVMIDHAALQIQGLIERSGPNTRMVWVRER
jgi:hypothetical protein